MIVSARDPFHTNTKIRYNKGIKKYKDTPEVKVYTWLNPELKSKVLGYLSNPEVDKNTIQSARDRYDYMNSEIIIHDDSLQQFDVLQYKWCKHCGERSRLFARGYNCECSKNEI